jgi:hypothetical protein
MDSWKGKWLRQWANWRERWELADHYLVYSGIFLVLLLVQLTLGWYWSREPAPFKLPEPSSAHPGVVLTLTLAQIADTLTHKPGGYIRNDVLPPGVLLDNMPSWELGVLQQVRSMTHSLHQEFGLSRAQFVEDADLAEADTAFNVNENSWIFPTAEKELRRGTAALRRYGDRLQQGQAQFSPRRDALLHWLGSVDARLGQLSARLNAALPDRPALLPTAEGDAQLPPVESVSWWQVDDTFYESRGSAWALMHLLKAVEVEFGPELEPRQALLSLRAAIHELEATQQTIWSPVILNGSGFGVFANHSLMMANYLSRARIDLQDVCTQIREVQLVPSPGESTGAPVIPAPATPAVPAVQATPAAAAAQP